MKRRPPPRRPHLPRVGLRRRARGRHDHVIDDFDRTSPEAFSFKDDKGTVFNASGGYQDDKKGKHGGIRYNIVSGGWGGWGIGLAGF